MRYGSYQTHLTADSPEHDSEDDGSSPLHVAAFNGDMKLCSYYISRGAIIDEPNQVMETPLHVAAWNGHVQVTALLINKGAAVNAKNENGETPLHLARSSCKWSCGYEFPSTRQQRAY
jgi:ankyrin repeat protein